MGLQLRLSPCKGDVKGERFLAHSFEDWPQFDLKSLLGSGERALILCLYGVWGVTRFYSVSHTKI